MPHTKPSRLLLMAFIAIGLTACAAPETTARQCLSVDSGQQCKAGEELTPEELHVDSDEYELVSVGAPTHMLYHTYQCAYPVSIRGMNCVPRMPVCDAGKCTNSVACGPPGTVLPIEHTTMSIQVESASCPWPDAVGPQLQAMRTEIEIVSVDAEGTLETTTHKECCYAVTTRSTRGLYD